LYIMLNAPSASPSIMICMPRNFMSQRESRIRASMMVNRLSFTW